MTVIPLHPALVEPPLSERTDSELMLLVRAGVAPAMAVLVERYHARLVSFCAKAGGGEAAEEIVQDTFVALWQSRTRYREEGKLVVWLYATARNRCRNHARGLRRRARWLAPAAQAAAIEGHSTDADHLSSLIARERQRDAERALSALSLKLREAVVLRFEHELPYDRIGEIVGADESTVRSRVYLALRRLRTAMDTGGSP